MVVENTVYVYVYARVLAFKMENSKLFIFLMAINSWNCAIVCPGSFTFSIEFYKTKSVHNINTTHVLHTIQHIWAPHFLHQNPSIHTFIHFDHGSLYAIMPLLLLIIFIIDEYSDAGQCLFCLRSITKFDYHWYIHFERVTFDLF